MLYVYCYSDLQGFNFRSVFIHDIAYLAEVWPNRIISLQEKDLDLFDLI